MVDQKTNAMEGCLKCLGCCCADFENTYDILVPNGATNTKFIVKEESGKCARACCNPYHGLTLHVKKDNNTKEGGEEILQINKPFKCCCFALCGPFQKEISVFRVHAGKTMESIGFAQEPCFGGILSPKLNMSKHSGGPSIGSVKGPCCCIGGCCRSEFEYTSPEGKELARLQRGGVKDLGLSAALLSNKDKYKLSFSEPALSVNDKLVLVSTLLMIDYMFFEGETTCVTNFCVCPPYCWCKLWSWYCCGCTFPCKVKLFVPEAVQNAKPL